LFHSIITALQLYMQFIITSEYSKMRLDLFLKEHFPELSRTHLQKLVKDGQVTVNEEKVTPHYFLKEGDEVEAVIEPVQDLRVVENPEVTIIKCDEEAPTPPNLPSGRGGKIVSPPLGGGVRRGQVCIIHEEPDFIVVNKPAGLVVHQGEGHKEPDTLANGLLARYPEIGKVGDDPVRPGIMHRLDADVSGVMVIARTQDMFDHLKKQFKTHEVEKEYVAVVEGKVSPPSGTIEFAIARKGARMVARPKHEEGKKAVTEYEMLSSDGKSSVLRIKIHTGRTHQIRVHLKAKGWPIVGDRLYNVKFKMKNVKLVEPGRLMLHASKLRFKDLKGVGREFEAKIPIEFNF